MLYRIRKNSLVEWAKKFTSVDALERFAARHGIEVYGIF